MGNVIDILGTVGGVMISLSLVPQVVKTYRTKSAEDISVRIDIMRSRDIIKNSS